MSEALTREIDELRLLMGSSRDPHGRVFAQLGDALRRAGAHREALGVLLDGVAEHPNFSPGHLVLGWTAQETGDLTVARTAFERTVELDPENPNALFGLGTLLEAEGDPRGSTLVAEAEVLDARVREAAPATAPDVGTGPDAVGMGDPDLEHLPFMSLAELAPGSTEDGPEDPGAVGAELADLPFIPLHELAPDAVDGDPAGSEAPESDTPEAGEAGLDDLPFVSLEELRPETGAAATAEAGGEAPEDPGAEEDEFDLAGPLATRTMGELLVRQGLTAQAVEVFEVLVARSPDDAGLRERLAELRAELPGAEADPDIPADGGGPPEAATSPGEAPTDLDDPHDTAAHPSMDPPVPHPEVPSPFHLGDGESEETEEGEGESERVGEYFARLLAWTPPGSDAAGDPSGEAEREEPSP